MQVGSCRIPETSSIAFSFVSRPNQPKGARRPSCAHADRQARDGACMHPQSSQAKASALSIFSWQWRGTQSQAAEIGWPACLRGEHASCMPTCGVERTTSPCLPCASFDRATGVCVSRNRTSASHMEDVLVPAISHMQICNSVQPAGVVRCARRYVHLCTVQYQTLRARASTCQFAGRPPSIVPNLDEGDMDQRVDCLTILPVFTSMHGSLI